jgi:hypothetical protein
MAGCPVVSKGVSPNPKIPAHYFVVAAGLHGEFFCSTLGGDTPDDADMLRAMVLAALIRRHPPLTVFDLADELQLTRFASVLWPGPRIAAIRAEIETERKRH